MSKIRALVVDDSAYNRQTIKSMLKKDPDIEVVGIASDGVDAISKTLRLEPDIITLDFEMPEMDGFSFLRWLMNEKPTPVIMVSSYSNKNMAIKALEYGAVDFIAKPTRRASKQLHNIEKDLLAKVRAALNTNMELVARSVQFLSDTVSEPRDKRHQSPYDIVAIGSSTGGPSALQIVLAQLPADLPAGIIISQHMPKGFTAPLAKRLNGLCRLGVSEASDGDEVKKGKALICPGGVHMELRRKGNKVIVKLIKPTEKDKYVPSVDRMMKSAMKSFKKRTFGVILTGMGNDGTEGMSGIKSAGGYTIAESEESAIVFGMPQEAIKAGAVEKVLSIDIVASEIRGILMGERRR
jgi:two-component system chemotaxis response regulator CheB